MKNWFRNMNARAQQWMIGRYGPDELYRTLSIGSLIFLLLSMLTGWEFFLYLAIIALFLGIFRCYSKNVSKRQKERAAYLRLQAKISGPVQLRKRMWRERKTHHYYKCPSCKTHMRVPRGKGTIQITCPKCHQTIIKKNT